MKDTRLEFNKPYKIISENEALRLIQIILNHEIDDEKIHSEIIDKIEFYQSGVSDEIYFSDNNNERTPEEILQRAREKNKPILL